MRHVTLALALMLVATAAAGAALAQDHHPGVRPGDRPPMPPLAENPPPRPPMPEGEPPGHDEGRPFYRGRVPPIFRDVTEEQVREILEFVDQYMPWRREELRKMQQEDPDRFRQLCRRLRFEIAQLKGLKERDERAFQQAIEERMLKVRAVDLALKARAAGDPGEREALTNELRRVLDRMFEVETVTREAHLRGIEERLESLRRELRERAEHRREIVEQRLRDALEGKPEPPPPPPHERGPEGKGPGGGKEPPPKDSATL